MSQPKYDEDLKKYSNVLSKREITKPDKQRLWRVHFSNFQMD